MLATATYDNEHGETCEITLNEQEMEICNASYIEIILYNIFYFFYK